MFFIVFIAYAQLGYILFGVENPNFRTYVDSIFTLLRTVLGDFDYLAIEKANRILGPIYFISYIFFVFFVLLNMFLAIINDTYSEVKAEKLDQRIHIGGYLKRQVLSLRRFLGERCGSASMSREMGAPAVVQTEVVAGRTENTPEAMKSEKREENIDKPWVILKYLTTYSCSITSIFAFFSFAGPAPINRISISWQTYFSSCPTWRAVSQSWTGWIEWNNNHKWALKVFFFSRLNARLAIVESTMDTIVVKLDVFIRQFKLSGDAEDT